MSSRSNQFIITVVCGITGVGKSTALNALLSAQTQPGGVRTQYSPAALCDTSPTRGLYFFAYHQNTFYHASWARRDAVPERVYEMLHKVMVNHDLRGAGMIPIKPAVIADVLGASSDIHLVIGPFASYETGAMDKRIVLCDTPPWAPEGSDENMAMMSIIKAAAVIIFVFGGCAPTVDAIAPLTKRFQPQYWRWPSVLGAVRTDGDDGGLLGHESAHTCAIREAVGKPRRGPVQQQVDSFAVPRVRAFTHAEVAGISNWIANVAVKL